MKNSIVMAGMLLALGAGSAALGQEVWTGLTYEFQKEAFADWTLPENQDRITDNVWITRADVAGIFNIAQEPGYQNFISPIDTEWSYGSAEDYANLDFTDWKTWHGSNPPSSLNQPAVVHLISDDIYIDIMFTEWSIGSAGGGGFAYTRAVPEPGSLALLGLAGLALLRRR